MQTTAQPKAKFNTERVAADMALKGWNNSDLARATRRSPQTIGRFLTGETQTPKVAGAIASALGYSIRRYFDGVEVAA